MWAVLGADQGEKWPWLEREGDPGRDLGRKVAQTRAGQERIRPKIGPNPSGRAVLGAGQVEKWVWPPGAPEDSEHSEARYAFFSIDIYKEQAKGTKRKMKIKR